VAGNLTDDLFAGGQIDLLRRATQCPKNKKCRKRYRINLPTHASHLKEKADGTAAISARNAGLRQGISAGRTADLPVHQGLYMRRMKARLQAAAAKRGKRMNMDILEGIALKGHGFSRAA
jgi:hypothetical protein